MADYIPAADPEFNSWQENFVTYAADNMAALGLTAADLTPVETAQTAWDTDYPAHVAATQAAQGATATKNGARAGYETLIRALVRRLQASPTITDAQRAGLGITIPDTDPTPSGPPTSRPVLSITCSQRLRQGVHFMDETTPTRKAKPAGVLGAEIWAKVGGQPPVDASELSFLGLSTRTPFTANFVGSQGGQIAYYWVRWVNSRGEKGPWSEMASATISA